MDTKNTTYILIIIFFIIGVVLGYAVHQPATRDVEKIVYVNTTVPAKTPEIAETAVPVTLTPTPAAATATSTPVLPDFKIKAYDPVIDSPTQTITLRNWRADPETMSIYLRDSILIQLTDLSLQKPVTLIFNSTVEDNLGTSGKRIVTFNKKGIYTFRAIISQSDPNINPNEYAKGTIIVN